MCSPFSHLLLMYQLHIQTHYISREIYFCKLVRRSVANANGIRSDIKTRALPSRSSMDIYADICNVYGSNSMSLSTVCRWVRHLSADMGPVTSAPRSVRSKSASSPKIE